MKPAKRRRNKRYRPKPVRTPLIVGAQLALSPISEIIDEIEREGTVTTNLRGTPIFRDSKGGWFDTAAAIEGVVWHLEMHCTRHSVTLPIEPLQRLHKCLKYMIPITEDLIRCLRTSMPVLQRAMAMADPDDQLDIIQQARIKEQLEKQGMIP